MRRVVLWLSAAFSVIACSALLGLDAPLPVEPRADAGAADAGAADTGDAASSCPPDAKVCDLASSTSAFQEIALDNTHVYWSDHFNVWRAPKGGGTPIKVTTRADKFPLQGFIVGDGNVYTRGMDGVVRVPLDGSQPGTISRCTDAFGLAHEPGSLYILHGCEPGTTSIQRYRGGTLEAPPLYIRGGMNTSVSSPIHVSNGNLYFALSEGTFTVSTDGGAGSNFSLSRGNVALAVRERWLFQVVKRNDARFVEQVTLGDAGAGENSTALASVYDAERAGLATDEARVFWTDATGTAGGSVNSRLWANLSGEVSTVRDERTPVGVAVDDAYVYWIANSSEATGGRVRRMAKP
jgi:hypothetical protein